MAELERVGVACCPPEQQTNCCEPQHKDGCCEPGDSSCGCARDGGQEAMREQYAPATPPGASTRVPR